MDCPNCYGTGKVDGQNCPKCEGTGKMKVADGARVLSVSAYDEYTADRLVLDATPRKTKGGYLIAHAKVARTGIQLYRGDELGVSDMAAVRVYRPESEVFKKSSMATYAHKPITLDHPPEEVTADNWKKFSAGDMGQEVVRDGHFISVPLTVMDRAVIDAVEKKNIKGLSVGYTMDLIFSAGTTKSGEQYDAIASNFDVNHLAIVQAGRAGEKARIGDKDQQERTMGTKTLTLDRVGVTVEDSAAQIIERAISDRDTVIADLKAKLETSTADAAKAKTASDAQIAELTKQVGVKDAEAVLLKKAVEDSKLTPAKLGEMVKDRQILIVKAASILGKDYAYTEKTDGEIKRDALTKHVGDAAVVKGFTEDGVNAAFLMATKDVKIEKAADGTDVLALTLDTAARNGGGSNQAVIDKAFDEGCQYLEQAYITAGAVAPPTLKQ